MITLTKACYTWDHGLFCFISSSQYSWKFIRCHNFTLMILMASSCSDPFPSPCCSCFQQDPKIWKTAISSAKCSDNCNEGAHGKSDTLQHYCLTALNRSQMILHSRECPAPPWALPTQWLGRDMREWLKQPHSAWAFPSTAGSRRLKSWAVVWPADGDSSLWIGPPARRLLSPR